MSDEENDVFEHEDQTNDVKEKMLDDKNFEEKELKALLDKGNKNLKDYEIAKMSSGYEEEMATENDISAEILEDENEDLEIIDLENLGDFDIEDLDEYKAESEDPSNYLVDDVEIENITENIMDDADLEALKSVPSDIADDLDLDLSFDTDDLENEKNNELSIDLEFEKKISKGNDLDLSFDYDDTEVDKVDKVDKVDSSLGDLDDIGDLPEALDLDFDLDLDLDDDLFGDSIVGLNVSEDKKKSDSSKSGSDSDKFSFSAGALD